MPVKDLTETEAKVAVELAKGRTITNLAERLDRSASTIETHKSRIYKKLNVNNRIGLARAVIRGGLLCQDKWLRSRV